MATERPAAWLFARVGLGVALAVVVAVLVALMIWIATGPREMPVAFGRSAVGVVGLVLSPIFYATLGGVLTAYVPRNPIGWIFLLVAVALGVMLPVNVLVSAFHEPLRPPPEWLVWVAWARTTLAAPVIVPSLIVAALVFPDGRPIDRRWRLVVWLAMAAGVVIVVTTGVDPRGQWSYPTLPNPASIPFGFEPLVGGVRSVAAGVIAVCGLLAVISLRVRYGRGDVLVRAQLRWIVVGAAVSGILALPYLLVRYVVEIGDSTGEAVAAVAQVGSCALPLAAAFAISKYRLFDVDAMIGRTLVYLPLMGILSGLYTASIALFQRIFVALTGETSDLAIVLTILLIASAFTPVRRALEGAVERRFPARPTAAVAVAPAPAVAEVAEAAASRPVKPLGRTATILSVGDGGVVPCPRGPSSVVECLSCPHLLATVPGEAPAVVCDIRPATA